MVLPSPITSVILAVKLFMRAPFSAFCNGATQQHNTLEDLLSNRKSCKIKKSPSSEHIAQHLEKERGINEGTGGEVSYSASITWSSSSVLRL